MAEQTPQSTGQTPHEQAQAITPELVQQVADRVYALLLEERRLERERKRRR